MSIRSTLFRAARIMKVNNPDDVVFVLVSYLPLPKHIGEMKTKPTQYAVPPTNEANFGHRLLLAANRRWMIAGEVLGRV